MNILTPGLVPGSVGNTGKNKTQLLIAMSNYYDMLSKFQ